ncbi:MAG: UDP-N-acetylmuramoyl-L-alanyl-D-glutamate--2,6-diaminopimelate ligase [Planctomycetota bacterium]|jgi:UDP-N-acetylmuramoyl-L-alanyl-D-glutamate--2,6-diaminopimelate ligase
MKLASLVEDLPVRIVHGTGSVSVGGITEDSRRVGDGDVFIARPGVTDDGRRYVADALRRGATAVLAASELDPSPAATILMPAPGVDIAVAGALLAERFHGDPSRVLKLVGITGTNGKTTTAWLIRQLLQKADLRCGLIGTVTMHDGLRRSAALLTTPPATELSSLLRRMVDNRCAAAVMEVSSHALHQRRTAGLAFEVAVFTNLSGDHLDYHGTEDAYADAKAMLFEQLEPGGRAVINTADPAAGRMVRRCRGHVIRCNVDDPRTDCHALIRGVGLDGTDVSLRGPWGESTLRLPLLGAYNVANALQAAAVGHSVGLSASQIESGLARCTPPPGRLEPVTGQAEPFTVLVDYAHTDDALDNALGALRPLVTPPGRLRVVFGCGGDRDRSKRPRMAQAAWRHADEVIVTSDNPRTEDPDAIIDEVMAGVPRDRASRTLREADREAAIRSAVARCDAGDVVLIAGKGHEDYQIIGTTRRPLDDRVIARAALTEGGP